MSLADLNELAATLGQTKARMDVFCGEADAAVDAAVERTDEKIADIDTRLAAKEGEVDAFIAGALAEKFPLVFDAAAGGTYGYTNTNGQTVYNSGACRLARFEGDDNAYLRAVIHKQGDLNYPSLTSHVELAWHYWNRDSNYGLHAKAGSLNAVDNYLWVTAEKELWFWSSSHWEQYGRLVVVAASDNVSFDFTTTKNMHTDALNGLDNWTGQKRLLVNSETSINIEDTFGAPA